MKSNQLTPRANLIASFCAPCRPLSWWLVAVCRGTQGYVRWGNTRVLTRWTLVLALAVLYPHKVPKTDLALDACLVVCVPTML